MPRRLASLAAVLCGLTLAPSAFAAKPKIAFRLEYAPPTPAEGCPDAEELALLLAGEFGYLVVRTDVSPVVRIEVHRVGRGFEAELWAPEPVEGAEPWHGRTDPQGTCRELAYDVAALVEARLGARAWGNEAPPPHLAAPPTIEVQSPELHPFTFRPPESLALLMPRPTAMVTDAASPGEQSSVQVTAAIGPAITPYGLPSLAVGGSGLMSFRWKPFALAVDVRGVVTPVRGIGPRDIPARTSLWTASILPCARTRFVDLCASVAVGRAAFHFEAPDPILMSDGFTVGFGGRVAGNWQFHPTYSLVMYGDAVADVRSVVFTTVDPTTGATVRDWRAPVVRLGLGVMFAATLSE
ncbi:hypothetical protein [Polyangium fumosum]|uniref:Uncharacterized protein n=1 Tax=Polyangium fumosum TaxID=889272 RepID=A0A4U1J9A8_9BACT|nr:hypothetical protein [Polyangium fumosum]TKD03457.1 hypothetical protein E8A74_26195 [Polyangium fumosum]